MASKYLAVLLLLSTPLFALKTLTSSVAFTDAQGNAVANGYVIFQLNAPARFIVGGQIVPVNPIKISLGAGGLVNANQQIAANDELQPTGTYYIVRIFNSNDEQVRGPENWILSGASPIDLALITSVNVPDPGLGNVVLQNPSAAQTITGQSLTLTASAPLTLQGPVTSSGANTWTGNNTFVGATTVTKLNNSVTVDGTQITTIQAAINLLPSNASNTLDGGVVYLPKGSYAPTSTITNNNGSAQVPLCIIGSGMNQTFIRPTAAVTTSVITLDATGTASGNAENFCLQDLTIDMTAVPGVNAITLQNLLSRPNIRRVYIVYPNGGSSTGIGINKSGNVSNPVFDHLVIQNPGTCVQDDMSTAGDDFYENLRCDSMLTMGMQINKTVTVDHGALYCLECKITDSNNRGGAAIAITPTTANTYLPVLFTTPVVDGIAGNVDSILLSNLTGPILFTNGWILNKTAQANLKSAIRCNACNGLKLSNSYVYSNGYEITLKGTVNDINISNNLLSGGGADIPIHMDTTPTLTNLAFWYNTVNTTPVTDSTAIFQGASLIQYNLQRATDGTVAAPAYSWFNDSGKGGLFRNAANDYRFAVNGALETGWDVNGFHFNNQLDVGYFGDIGLCRGSSSVLNVSTSTSSCNSGGTVALTNLKASAPPTATGTLSVAGTGACATITTTAGGSWAGTFKCTAATAASTVTITPGITAPNGFTCSVYDETTRANLLQQTSHNGTTCVLTATSITQNDVFVFQATAF